MEENNKENIKLSVCISVHNTAKYLRRCLDSVIAQDFDGLEIVLVNNGSTDESGSIMNEYKKMYKKRRIFVYEQEDRGLAQGRQTGVNHAFGEYITFLDADDYVLPGAYSRLYSTAAQSRLDIVEMQTKHGGEIISSGYSGIKKCHDIFRDYCKNGGVIPTMLWMRIYRRTLFEKPVFPEFYMNNEDYFAFPCLLLAGGRMGFVNKPLHVYSDDNADSVMTRLREDPAFASKYYQTQVTAMRASEHVWNFLEPDFRCRFEQELKFLKYNHIVNFLFRNYPGKSYHDKTADVIDTMGFKSEKELEQFLKMQAVRKGTRNHLIHMLGTRNAYYLAGIRNRFRRW